MTTARDIVTQALREGGILALGETAGADSLDEGLQRLNVLVRGLLGYDLGEALTVINLGLNGITTSYGIAEDMTSEVSSSYLPSNSYIHANLSAAQTVYLDPNPDDGARIAVLDLSGNFSTAPLTIDANGKKIESSGTLTLNTDSTNTEWFYRKDLGTWVKVSLLAASDPLPFPLEFDDYFVTTLAFRLSRRYGQEVSPEMMATLGKARSQFRARYAQRVEKASELGWQRISPNYGWEISNFNFNRGRPWNY